MVNDSKILLKVLVLYIPLPVFWALFDQQGSRWTFQATRMDGLIGSYDIKPDQVQVINPFLILVFIPLYDIVFYPLLSKIGIRRPLQKLTLGGTLAGVAFLISAIVELQLEKTYPILPVSGESQLRIFNTLPCDFNVVTNNPQEQPSFIIQSMGNFENKYVKLSQETQSFTYTFTPISGCAQFSSQINLESNKAISFLLHGDNEITRYVDDPNKSSTGDPLIRILLNTGNLQNFFFKDVSNGDNIYLINTTNIIGTSVEVYASTYNIFAGNNENGQQIASLHFKQGGVHTMLIRQIDQSYNYTIIEIAAPNSMHMLWLVPQYVVMTLGEVMYSVTGLAFSYSQAPVSMKAVLQACWLLTVAFGNLIVVIVAGSKGFSSQVIFEFNKMNIIYILYNICYLFILFILYNCIYFRQLNFSYLLVLCSPICYYLCILHIVTKVFQ